jgi:hypothetical protein
MWPVIVRGQESTTERELRRQIQEREAEITALRQQVEQLRTQQLNTPSPSGMPQASAQPIAQTRPAAPAKDQPQSVGEPTVGSSNTAMRFGSDDDELASALESSLVRQGAAVLSPGVIEVQPELNYFYDEPNTGKRRDSFGAALALKRGLPLSLQLEAYIPYTIHDRISGSGSSSGIGDVTLGLTKQLLRDQKGQPTLLLFGRWRIPTGDIDRTPATGYGQHGIQIGATLTKRMDPVLLLSGLSYTLNPGSAHLQDGTRIKAGNSFGVRAGVNLAATPDISLYWGLSYFTSGADRVNGERVDFTDRARAYLDLGGTTVVGRGRFLNLGVSLGVTPAAPRVSINASLPFRF